MIEEIVGSRFVFWTGERAFASAQYQLDAAHIHALPVHAYRGLNNFA